VTSWHAIENHIITISWQRQNTMCTSATHFCLGAPKYLMNLNLWTSTEYHLHLSCSFFLAFQKVNLVHGHICSIKLAYNLDHQVNICTFFWCYKTSSHKAIPVSTNNYKAESLASMFKQPTRWSEGVSRCSLYCLNAWLLLPYYSIDHTP